VDAKRQPPVEAGDEDRGVAAVAHPHQERLGRRLEVPRLAPEHDRVGLQVLELRVLVLDAVLGHDPVPRIVVTTAGGDPVRSFWASNGELVRRVVEMIEALPDLPLYIEGEELPREPSAPRFGGEALLAPVRIRSESPVSSAGVRRRCESPVFGADENRRCSAPTRNAGAERRRRATVGRRGSAGGARRAGAALRAALVGLLEAPELAGDLHDLDPVAEAVEEGADAGRALEDRRPLARSCVCSVCIVPWREITNSRSTLPLQPGGWTGPKSITVPTSSVPALVLVLVLALAELPAESSAGPMDDVSPPVELPLVDADTLVIAGPVENPGGLASLQAARIRAARVNVRIAYKPSIGPARCQLENAHARDDAGRVAGLGPLVSTASAAAQAAERPRRQPRRVRRDQEALCAGGVRRADARGLGRRA